MVQNLESSFFRFVTMHAFDRQTDRRTDGRTDSFLIARPRYSVVVACSAVKTADE